MQFRVQNRKTPFNAATSQQNEKKTSQTYDLEELKLNTFER